ncbi:DUF433 domain-containing protein [bacterium]|nr:DUF433 domain-containing protein [bacterium]
MYNRISIDPNVCHGQACIKGNRIPVHQIILMLTNGDTIEALLEAYPSITCEDILLAWSMLVHWQKNNSHQFETFAS